MRRLAVGLAISCGSSSTPLPPPELTGSTVAVAGSVAIDAALVSSVARATGQSPRAAVDALLYDAVLAQGAVARKLERAPDVREAQRSARARLVTDRLARAAEAKGPPTDEEIAAVGKRRWRDVDLPEQVRVVHVVVMADKDPAKQRRARTVAEDLRRAVEGARDAGDFIARTKLVDPQGLQIVPQSLPVFVADGRSVDGGPDMDTTFAAAAFKLAPDETSDIVETQFGLHVIRMLERLPPKHVPFAEQRLKFTNDVYAQRGRDAYVALLAELKRAHPVASDPAADALMASAIVP